MSRSLRQALLIAAALALTTPLLATEPDPAGGWLITPDEAALADAPAAAPSVPDLRGRVTSGTGPRLEMVAPEEGQPARAPVSIVIKFTPTRAPVDLDTLKVTLLKVIKIDITERLRPYASVDGIRIEDGRIPAGKYRLRLQLADVDGNLTVGEGELHVI